jgi:beta-lactamase regulating signal transducer with metallopeptidase domain
MSGIPEHINLIGKTFAEFAWPLLIRSSVLMLILLLAELLLRNRVRAALRYWMWMLVPMQLILPISILSFAKLDYHLRGGLAYLSVGDTTTAANMSVMPQTPNIRQQSDGGDVAPGAATPPRITWQAAIFLIWLAVVAVMVLLLVKQTLSARRIIRQAREANALMKGILGYCCACMGVRARVRLKVSVDTTSPIVCGLLRPVILVPRNLALRLGSRHLRSVLLHELAHIKHGDLGLNLLQTVLQIAYFYNPLLWLVNSVIRTVRDQAVDENVLVAVGEEARWYPETLTNVAELDLKDPDPGLSLIGLVESKSTLISRIKHIVNRPWPGKHRA